MRLWNGEARHSLKNLWDFPGGIGARKTGDAD
jgi:hypothetical protein